MSVAVSALFRYPVKGFPAEKLAVGTLRTGSGFDGDRAAAFSSGRSPVPAGVWSEYRGFSVLKSDPSLQAWGVDSVGTAITLRAPDGEATSFRTDDPVSREAASEFLAARLTARGPHPRRLVVADQGMFDSRPSGVSLINPATVAALSAAAGIDLDPLRFRGNVHLANLPPFAEFGLIGTVVRLGGARLWIRSSIERCPATRVDPTTAVDDVNVPRLLAGILGHLHCGIYGVVLDGGEVRPGDALTVLDDLGPAVPAGLDPSLAKPGTTPRCATVLETAADASPSGGPGQVRMRLRDDRGWFAGAYRPGMHVRVHLTPPDGPLWRTYTVTRAAGSEFELGVGIDGAGSRALTGLPTGAPVLVSGPFGRLTADTLTGGRTIVLTAGIGITAAFGLLPGLPAARPVRLVHVEASPEPSGFARRLAAAAEGRPGTSVTRWSTAVRGRPGARELAAVLDDVSDRADAPTAADLVLCGPPSFVVAAEEAARLAGISPERVHREVFGSPRPLDAHGDDDLSAWAPAAVRTASGSEIRWEPAAGFLLDALEAAGVDAPSSCRGGSCGTCVLRLDAGQVAYPVEPAAVVADGEVVTCAAVPDGDVVLGI